MNIKNIRNHYEVNISNYEAELYEHIVSAQLLVIFILGSNTIKVHVVQCKVYVNPNI